LLLDRLGRKIQDFKDEIIDIERFQVDDAKVLVVSYGISSRPAKRAVKLARAEGLRVGMLRLKSIWPFPEELIKELAPKVDGFVVPEVNEGQVSLEVERAVAGVAAVVHVGAGGRIHHPQEILEVIREVRK